MIRKFLFLCIIAYFGYYVVYPQIQFDTTPPSVELLSKKIGENYIININEKNLIKIQDDFGLKEVVLYFSNQDTNNKFEKMYFSKLNGDNNILNLNDTMLKKVLSSYISSIKLKISVTDNSISKNVTEKIYDIKLDNKKPHIKVINKSLYTLNKGSLIAVTLQTYDNESSISKILVNGDVNFSVIPNKSKKISNLLIPADNDIIKSKKLTIESIDTVGNKNSVNTYFLTKSNSDSFTIDTKQNSLINTVENLKIKLERSAISIPSLYKEDLETIDNVISNISKDIKSAKISSNTLLNIVNPVFNNDKIKIIDFNNKLFFGEKELLLNGSFYNANIYQSIMSPLNGTIVFMDALNILGNTIIIKNSKNLYTIIASIKEFEADLQIGKKINKGQKIGKPEKNDIFGANFYFSANLNGKYIKPYYFFNPSYYDSYIQKVFNKRK